MSSKYLGVIISHIPGRYLRSKEDVRTRYSRFFHERSDRICARLFVTVGTSRVHVSVTSGKGVTSDLFAVGCRSAIVMMVNMATGKMALRNCLRLIDLE